MAGKIGCTVSGFIMYTVGLLQINLVTVISMERYYIIYKPFNISKITFKLAGLVIIGCIAFSLLFTILPLFGWSYYSLEGSLTSCSVEWADRSWNVMSYNITIWLFGYIIPLSVIIYCNIKTLRIVISFLIR